MSSSLVAAQVGPLSNTDPNIPADTTSTCANTIISLNKDDDSKACISRLAGVVKGYMTASNAPGTTEAANANALKAALNALCAPGAGCDAGMLKGKLKAFSDTCMTDLVAQSQYVMGIYDQLYLLSPFLQALCTKDTSGEYCINTLSQNGNAKSTTSSRRSVAGDMKDHSEPPQQVWRSIDSTTHEKRQGTEPSSGDASQTSDNIPFLFIQPTSPKSILCGTCTQKILAAYINFETASPYAIGLKNSPNLNSQSALYKAGKETCGDTWARSVNQLAGTTAFADVSAAHHGSGDAGSMLHVALVGASVSLAALLL
ncbi:hypothetical protein K437DRAFT_270677 [Tilletiaria anomala UBC 951]|uniref:Uncharacterized protein n=1 Tax=Tilletiaria anomala (strain ATCC 24038 / CBS 436.72 / UBC 951) TaxID=1037660 RepID=A0A066V8G6_TILAU|nr:uncharacterized protein K437DRAFT_270677 [Tilletiaria anomala UBC 951]KDN38032.1 hypothetical protein K437DRAFT_270677 [Tilletiaria anomala UBC 951]